MKKIVLTGIVAALLIVLTAGCDFSGDEDAAPAPPPAAPAPGPEPCNSASAPINIPAVDIVINVDGFDDDWSGVAPVSASCFEGGGLGAAGEFFSPQGAENGGATSPPTYWLPSVLSSLEFSQEFGEIYAAINDNYLYLMIKFTDEIHDGYHVIKISPSGSLPNEFTTGDLIIRIYPMLNGKTFIARPVGGGEAFISTEENGSGYFIYDLSKSSITPYMTVSELIENSNSMIGRNIQIRGRVEKNSLQDFGMFIQFSIYDEEASLEVIYTGSIVPGFKEENEVVLIGSLNSDGDFEAEKMILKCPSKYEEFDEQHQ